MSVSMTWRVRVKYLFRPIPLKYFIYLSICGNDREKKDFKKCTIRRWSNGPYERGRRWVWGNKWTIESKHSVTRDLIESKRAIHESIVGNEGEELWGVCSIHKQIQFYIWGTPVPVSYRTGVGIGLTNSSTGPIPSVSYL